MNKEKIINELENLIDLASGKTYKEIDAIKYFGYDEDKDCITLIIKITDTDDEKLKIQRRQIARIVKIDNAVKGLKLELEKIPNDDYLTDPKTFFIGIISGKGGVGKSSVAANLACSMARKGIKVGLIDADIYGSSLPTVLNLERQKLYYDDNKKIVPYKYGNMELISTEFFTEESQPVIWRGGMLNNMLTQFFKEVAWDKDIKYFIIDFPPGTGDIMLDIKNIIPKCKMLLVTTPHAKASHVAIKAGLASKTLGHEILGIIENMAYFVGDDQKKYYIFGQDGAKKVAEKLDSTILASLEIKAPKDGSEIYQDDENNGKIYNFLVDYLLYNLSN